MSASALGRTTSKVKDGHQKTENGDENTDKIWKEKSQLVVKLTSVRGHVVRKEKNFAILRMFPKNISSIAIQLKIKGSPSINGSTIIYELPNIKCCGKKNENELIAHTLSITGNSMSNFCPFENILSPSPNRFIQ